MHVVKILKIEQVTHDVKRFITEKPENYEYEPGQATNISINKPELKDDSRPFTFTSTKDELTLEFTIKIYPTKNYSNHDGFTEKLNELKEGDELLIEDAWGAIKYKGRGTFIAGGAGITPFIAILRDLNKQNKIKGNKLIFSNKTSKDIILEDELKEMLGDNLILTLTEEKNDKYEYGRVNREFIETHIKDYSQKFYICGPNKMVQDIKKELESLGARTNALIFEK